MQSVAKRTRNVSLADIARLSGVSTTTVSRVLGGRRGPGQQSRQAVLDAAAMLGYTPNAIARAVSTSRTRLIGAIIADLADPFFADLLDGAQAEASLRGFHLLVASSRRDPRVELALIEDFRGYRVEGIVLAGTPHHDLTAECNAAAAMASLGANGIQVIQIGVRRGPAPLLHIDFSALAADATRHLLELGHRRIGYVGRLGLEEIRDRHLAGMDRALTEMHITPDPSVRANWGDAGLIAAIAERGVTAILAADDSVAAAVMLSLRSLGLGIPEDVSVMGMEGARFASELIRPELSTVALPLKEMGARAIQEIFRTMDGGEPVYETVLPHELLVRDSTAAPRSKARKSREG